MKKIKCIYKIISPTGKIYIGQSTNLLTRYYHYQSLNCKSQPKLFYSLKKYGFKDHSFEIIYSFPSDVKAEVLTIYEQFFINQFREAGYELMNIKEAGNHGGHSEETKLKIGLKHKGKVISEEQRKSHSEKMKGRPSPVKGRKLTNEQKLHLSKLNKGKPLPESARIKLIGRNAWNKGLIGVDNNWFGKSHSEETKKKIRQKLLGSKLSPETIAKRTATLKKNGVKRRWSEESKRKQSERYLGKTKSAETIEKGRATRLLKKLNSSNGL